MRLIVSALVVAACAPTFQSASRSAQLHNADEDKQLAARAEAVAARLGAARFEPQIETRANPERTGLVTHPTEPMLAFRVEDGRVGYVTYGGSPCGEAGPETTALFATTATGVTIVLVEPEVKRSDVRTKGACGMPGCGAQPPPPPERIAWLPIDDPAKIVVEHVRVPYEQHTVSCEHPSYPP